jgi:hypothetical protein
LPANWWQLHRKTMTRRPFWTGVGVALAIPLAGLAVAYRIEPLLPPRGGIACFAGTFQTANTLSASRPGTNGSHPVAVRDLRLRLSLPESERPYRSPGYSYDWRYGFVLIATLDDKRALRAAGACNWLDHPVSHLLPLLDCYIDCDGGGIDITRIAGGLGVHVNFDAGGWLRFSRGCGAGGGVILAGGGTARAFRLEGVPADQCAAD